MDFKIWTKYAWFIIWVIIKFLFYFRFTSSCLQIRIHYINPDVYVSRIVEIIDLVIYLCHHKSFMPSYLAALISFFTSLVLRFLLLEGLAYKYLSIFLPNEFMLVRSKFATLSPLMFLLWLFSRHTLLVRRFIRNFGQLLLVQDYHCSLIESFFIFGALVEIWDIFWAIMLYVLEYL